jgi:hypothetical protein
LSVESAELLLVKSICDVTSQAVVESNPGSESDKPSDPNALTIEESLESMSLDEIASDGKDWFDFAEASPAHAESKLSTPCLPKSPCVHSDVALIAIEDQSPPFPDNSFRAASSSPITPDTPPAQ